MAKKRASLPQEFKCQPILCNGILFPSLNALAAHYGVNRCTIKQRIRKRMSVEEAVSKPVKTLRKSRYSSDGKRLCVNCRRPIEKTGNRHGQCIPCQRRYGAEKKRGVPRGTYIFLWERQKGLCKCCQRKFREIPSQRSPHMDHCHQTGAVRGLLCHECNVALGIIGESKEHALAVAEYIVKYCDPLKQSTQ